MQIRSLQPQAIVPGRERLTLVDSNRAARVSVDPERDGLLARLRATEKRLAARTAERALTRGTLERTVAARRRLEIALETAVIEERARIAREIHDTVAQALTGIIIQLRNADAALLETSPDVAREDVERAMALARDGLEETRRCIQAWRAPAPDRRDLSSAIEKLVARMTSGTDLRAVVAVKGVPRKLGAARAENVLRVVQESLTNVLRHARATRFEALIEYERTAVRLTTRDNGRGFNPAENHEGFGLLGIKERVAALRGHLTITSAVGQGTTTSVVLPCR